LPILAKLYVFYQLLIQTTATFPKSQRYSLGQKLDNLTLEIIELIFGVHFTDNRLKQLQRISVKLDLLKILVRLSKDSVLINTKKYFQLELKLSEIGKMLGGWIRGYNKQAAG